MPGSPTFDLSKNQILADLPEDEIDRLRPHLGFVSTNLRDFLYKVGEPLRFNYFPQDSVISSLAHLADGRSVEVGLEGNEAVVGVEAILGAKTATKDAVVQVPGGCLKIRTEVLQTEFRRNGVLHFRVLRYLRDLIAQVTQTAACNRVHRLDQRLPRWLLMTHNRAGTDVLPMTHEFLSHMLGTPRSEVSIAAANLRKSGLIRYGRGHMIILDRKGLESASCECYQAVDGK